MTLNEFLERFPTPGRILFAKIWGSKSHNTDIETSDTDFSGVYICPTSKMLSLDPPQETFKYDKEDGTQHACWMLPSVSKIDKNNYPDYQFHEVGRFAELLMKGNPGIIEMLYTNKLFISSPEWESLRENRNRFLSQDVMKQYLGYMQGQLKRLIASEGKKGLHTKNGSYNEKWAYHILRLAEDARRIAFNKEPVVWKDGLERDFLLKVRHNEFTWEEVKNFIEDAIASIDLLKPWKLPENGDKNFLNDWLLKLRKENW